VTIVLSIIVLLIIVIAGLAVFSSYVANKVEKALPPQGKFVDIGGDRIHYVEQGSGPAIVIVHGLAGQLLNFAYLPMQELARSHRVILIDRPGAGYSTRGAQSSAAIFSQAATVAGFIDALKLDKPMLVGHSLGGALALAVALNHPQSVSRLALIAPLTHAETDPPAAFRGLAIPSALMRRVISHTLAIPLSIKTGAKVLEVVFGPEPVPKDFRVKGGGLLGLRPRSFYAASTDMLAISADMPTMGAPVRGTAPADRCAVRPAGPGAQLPAARRGAQAENSTRYAEAGGRWSYVAGHRTDDDGRLAARDRERVNKGTTTIFDSTDADNSA
jgi:pimeloyl-ACP methyl ester carboxylesterase